MKNTLKLCLMRLTAFVIALSCLFGTAVPASANTSSYGITGYVEGKDRKFFFRHSDSVYLRIKMKAPKDGSLGFEYYVNGKLKKRSAVRRFSYKVKDMKPGNYKIKVVARSYTLTSIKVRRILAMDLQVTPEFVRILKTSHENMRTVPVSGSVIK